MSKDKPVRKKVVVKTTSSDAAQAAKPRTRSTAAQAVETPLIFGRQTYIWMGIGVALMALGMLLMSGGQMPSDEVWDDSIIYSARRTVLAPMLILLGLGVEVYALFKR